MKRAGLLSVLLLPGFAYCGPAAYSGPEVRLGWVVLGLYLLAFAAYLAAFFRRRQGATTAGDILLGVALFVHLAAILIRGRVAGHLPFASRFEALLFYGFVTALLAWLVNFRRRDLPVALLTLPVVMVFMLGVLIGGEKAPKALMPVLNSPFFGIHVVAAFIGYAFYTVSFALALGALFAPRKGPGSVEELLGLARQMVPPGLVFLGAGIGLGSAWALYSWGNWWGWDPKENAALITWFGYLLFVHSPAWKRTPRRLDALFLIAAFVLLVATFLGVNLLGRGLHVYQ